MRRVCLFLDFTLIGIGCVACVFGIYDQNTAFVAFGMASVAYGRVSLLDRKVSDQEKD